MLSMNMPVWKIVPLCVYDLEFRALNLCCQDFSDRPQIFSCGWTFLGDAQRLTTARPTPFPPPRPSNCAHQGTFFYKIWVAVVLPGSLHLHLGAGQCKSSL